MRFVGGAALVGEHLWCSLEERIAPLTGFLCVFPKIDVDTAWKILSHPATVANLSLVGKSYGSGAIKVEPRALERLPIPQEVVLQSGVANAPINLSTKLRVKHLQFHMDF